MWSSAWLWILHDLGLELLRRLLLDVHLIADRLLLRRIPQEEIAHTTLAAVKVTALRRSLFLHLPAMCWLVA